ncbi:MAG TPA: hypothetical protein VI958_05750, partial [Acidobacteriota bacterium]
MDKQDASMVKPWKIDLAYDFVENLFLKPGDKTQNVRAQDINTIDEVPDSNWYRNHKSILTPEDVKKGPDTTNGPAPGKWTIIGAKSDGVTPGFTIRDSEGQRWFIKFDPPDFPAMATGTEVAVTKLFWALGYHVPENHLAVLQLENLTIDKEAEINPPSGNKRAMKLSDVRRLLSLAGQNPDGTYRVVASKALPGKPLGGFRFYATRPDDPNDIIPHEHRRSLRGYGAFAAWLNHVDSKSINSLDVLVSENGRSMVRHYLLDFGATLGSGSLHPHEHWEGYESLYEGHGNVGQNALKLGFPIERWRRIPFYEAKSIGRFPMDNRSWDPDSWVPREPNPAFLRSRPDDKFWAARKLMALSKDVIAAAIQAGQFHDAKSEEFLINALIERKEAIGRKYLTAVNPIVDPQLGADGVLRFSNAAVEQGFASPPRQYQAVWYRFDNESGRTEKLGESLADQPALKAPAGWPLEQGTFLKIEIAAQHDSFTAWQVPV